MRILVVDDTEENRRYLGALLKGQAHEVVFALNGEEALEKLSPGGIDLIISDILMPVMDGYRFCRECKQDPRLKEIPFIFITSSYTEEKDEEFALSLGAERFLRRPIEALAMVSAINEVLSGRRKEKDGSLHRAMQEESRYLSEYSNRVVKKLEDKVRELEAAISERRRIERAFRALSECNQALLRASDERGLLQEICRIVVEIGGYCFVWAGFAGQDRERSVSVVAQCGHGEGFLENAGITWADTERGRGPTGTAIRTGIPQVNQDLLSDPRMAPWREAALQNGFAACISLPLKDEGGAFAALTIYSCEPYAFNSEEVELLIGLSDDLSFGLVSLRAKAGREQALEALRESEQRYREIFDNTSDGMFIIDVTPEGRFIPAAINPVAERMTGVSTAVLIGGDIKDLFPAAFAEMMNRGCRRCIASDSPASYEEDLSLVPGMEHFYTIFIPLRKSSGVDRIIVIVEKKKEAGPETGAETANAEGKAEPGFL